MCPTARGNLYLKEISGLAKVLSVSDALAKFTRTESLNELREHLLDWVSQAIGEAVPDAKARMIKLDARQSSLETAEPTVLTNIGRFMPSGRRVLADDRIVVLTVDGGLAEALERDEIFRRHIKSSADFEAAGYHIVRLKESDHSHGRKTVTAVAFKHPT